MYTLKCYKHNGTKHVYAATSYTVHPPKANAQGEIVTEVESHDMQGGGIPVHHVCLNRLPWAYREIYIENISGKTVEVIRGSIKAYADPNAGQASEIDQQGKVNPEDTKSPLQVSAEKG
jgi:hypothetical protein